MTAERPLPPPHLSAASKRWWAQIVAGFDLGPHDLRLLQLAAEAWDRGQQARVLLKREGLTTKDRYDRPKVHPAVAIERDSRLAFARLVRELALDADPPAATRPPRDRRYR